jgi:DNA-binding MarR family transcriptional regulator
MPAKLLPNNPALNSWIIFRNTYNATVKCEEELFFATGITAQQFAVLMAIKYIGKTVTQTNVANWLDRSTNSITMIIDRMAKDGLVKRARDLPDRRAVRLVITAKGAKVFKRTVDPHTQFFASVMSALSAEETREFTRLLDKVRDKVGEYRTSLAKARDEKPRPRGTVRHRTSPSPE